ncbi:MAG: flagellar hook-length control protein FliK [Betaproteobacteria bacterium]|nr:flagellar hook-length control protein FliK [Betaproteobacteria bacterium]
MKSMPITPGITPPSSPSQAAAAGGVNPNAGAGANATSSDSSSSQGGSAGQNFNDVLARQMAAPEPKAATTSAAATAAATDATLLKSVAGDKPEEKKGTGTPDATAAASANVGALMGLPLVPGQIPLATAQPAVSSAGASSSQPSSLGGQAQTSLMASGFHNLSAATEQAAIAAAAGGQPTQTAAAPQEPFSRSLEQAVDQAASALASVPAGGVATQGRDSHAGDAAATAPIQPQGAAQMLMSYAPAAGSTGMPQSISSPVGSNRWGDELGQKITWMTTQTDHSAELHLNPPDLGPLKVVLHVSGDQASAFFTSPHAAVREAVSQALPRLRDMLADNGIMLGNTSVSDQGGQGAQNPFAGSSQQYPGSSGNGVIEVSSLPSGTRAATSRVSQGLVDTFA